MSSIYCNGEYARKNPGFHAEDSEWKARQVLSMVRRHELLPEVVAEVGCGAGAILCELEVQSPAGVRFVGYDISPQAIALARRAGNTRVEFVCGDLLDSSTSTFDLLLCIDVVEHVDDYMGFLRRLRSKGRRFIFHVPLDLSVQTVLRSSPIMRVRRQVGHLHYFTKETALASLQDAGYRILDWRYTASGLDRPKSLKARIGRIPRMVFFMLHRDVTVRLLGGYSLLVLAE